MKTNYFYYRRYLDRDIWIPLETYSYLMAREFKTTLRRTQTGIYFVDPVDPKQSNDIVIKFRELNWLKRVVITFKAKTTYPQDDT